MAATSFSNPFNLSVLAGAYGNIAPYNQGNLSSVFIYNNLGDFDISPPSNINMGSFSNYKNTTGTAIQSTIRLWVDQNNLVSMTNRYWNSASFNFAGTLVGACEGTGAGGNIWIGSKNSYKWNWIKQDVSRPGNCNSWSCISLNSNGNLATVSCDGPGGGILIGSNIGSKEWSWVTQTESGLSQIVVKSASLNSEGTVAITCTDPSSGNGDVWIGTGTGASQWTWVSQSNQTAMRSNNFWSVSLNSAGTLAIACDSYASLSGSPGYVWIGSNTGSNQWTWVAQSNRQDMISNLWRGVSLNSAGTVAGVFEVVRPGRSNTGDIWIGTGTGASQWTWAPQSNQVAMTSNDWHGISLNSAGNTAMVCERGGDLWIGTGTGASQWAWVDQSIESSIDIGTTKYWQFSCLNSAGDLGFAGVSGGDLWAYYKNYNYGIANQWMPQTDINSSVAVGFISINSAGTVMAFTAGTSDIFIGKNNGNNNWTWVDQSNQANMRSNNWTCVSINSNGNVAITAVKGKQLWIGTDTGSNQLTWVGQSNQAAMTSNEWADIYLNSEGTLAAACITANASNGDIWIGSNTGSNQWTWVDQSNQTAMRSNSWQGISLNSAGTVAAACIGNSSGSNGDVWIGTGTGASQWTWVDQSNQAAMRSNNWYRISLNSAGTVAAACETGGDVWIGSNTGSNQWTWVDQNAQSAMINNSWADISLNSEGNKAIVGASPKIGSGRFFIGIGLGASQWTWVAQINSAFTTDKWKATCLNSLGDVGAAADGNGNLYIYNTLGITTWSAVQSNNSLPTTSNWKCVSFNSAGNTCAGCITSGGIYIGTASNVYSGSNPNQWTWSAVQSANSLPTTTASWQATSLNSAGTVAAVCACNGAIYMGQGSGATQWAWSAAQSNVSVPHIPTNSNWLSVSLNGAGTVCASAVSSGSVYIGTGTGSNKWTWSDTQSGIPTNSNWQKVSLNSAGTICAACIGRGPVYIGTGIGATDWTWSAAQSGIPTTSNWKGICLNSPGNVAAACVNGGGIYIGTGVGATQWTWSGVQTGVGTTSNWNAVYLNSSGTICAACMTGGPIYIGQGTGATQWVWTLQNTNSLPTSSNWACVSMNAAGTGVAACIYGRGIYMGFI